MPHSVSARKRVRQNEKRRLRNRSVRSAVKTTVRKCRDAAASGDAQAAQDLYRAAARVLDKAVSRGALHKRTAARHKSRLARRVNQVTSGPAEA